LFGIVGVELMVVMAAADVRRLADAAVVVDEVGI